MAAGLGFKDFVTGEVLTAADVDGYLMQGVWVFASAAARDAAVTSPQEGNFAYLKDTNVTTYYTGSAWANLDTTGMTNPMTTTGDTIYSSSGSTPARLGIGTSGQVLTISGGGVPSWATPAGGGSGLTLIQRSTFSNVATTTTTFDGVFTTTYAAYLIVVEKFFASSSSNDAYMQMRGSATTKASGYYGSNYSLNYAASAFDLQPINNANQVFLGPVSGSTGSPSIFNITISQVGQGSSMAPVLTGTGALGDGNAGVTGFASVPESGTYDGVIFSSSSSNISGTIAIYGLAK
jgi:hypothetical protein